MLWVVECLSYPAQHSLLRSLLFLCRSLFSLLLLPPCAQCTVGSQVAMRVGGDFYFAPSPSDPSVDLLLVAGGVGINPLYSILLHTADLLHVNRASGGRDYNIGSAHLCYSAKNTQELLFKVPSMCCFWPLEYFDVEFQDTCWFLILKYFCQCLQYSISDTGVSVSVILWQMCCSM